MEDHLKFKMILNVILKSVVFVQMFLTSASISHYDILFRDEGIFTTCEIPDTYDIEEYFDESNMFFEYLNNGSLYTHGEAVWRKDTGTGDNHFSVEVFKKNRDQWISTIYTIKRRDFCKAAFDPTEVWSFFMESIQDKTCPFHKGQVLHFNFANDLTLHLPDPRLAGEYKIQWMIPFKGINETLCANIFVNLYKT